MTEESKQFCVLVDCGESEWFSSRDIRVHGPFTSALDAGDAKRALDDRKLIGREGEPIKTYVQPLTPLDVEGYSVG